jgi:hypothetical protein
VILLLPDLILCAGRPGHGPMLAFAGGHKTVMVVIRDCFLEREMGAP